VSDWIDFAATRRIYGLAKFGELRARRIRNSAARASKGAADDRLCGAAAGRWPPISACARARRRYAKLAR